MSLPHEKVTPQQYLEIERTAEIKSEYLDGEMFAMSGSNHWHDRIKTNLTGALLRELHGRPCSVYSSDMRVKAAATGLYTYPDASALCGDEQFEDDLKDTLLNPSAVFEVLSRTTAAYDRGDKFGHYRSVQSIKEYVLIAQDRVSVERYTRQPDGTWNLVPLSTLDDVLEIPSVGARISVAEIYDRVDLSEAYRAYHSPRRTGP